MHSDLVDEASDLKDGEFCGYNPFTALVFSLIIANGTNDFLVSNKFSKYCYISSIYPFVHWVCISTSTPKCFRKGRFGFIKNFEISQSVIWEMGYTHSFQM
jgi:hypothetical protein